MLPLRQRLHAEPVFIAWVFTLKPTGWYVICPVPFLFHLRLSLALAQRLLIIEPASDILHRFQSLFISDEKPSSR